MKKIFLKLIIIIIISIIVLLVLYLIEENRPSLVIPGLWLGNFHSSQNEKFLKDNQISIVINCSKNLPFTNLENIQKIRIPVNDSNSEKDKLIMLDYFPSLFSKTIFPELKAGKSILIHCRAGIQRSATVVLCYLVTLSKNPNLENTKQFLRSKRKIVFLPWNNFQQCQEEWFNSLKT